MLVAVVIAIAAPETRRARSQHGPSKRSDRAGVPPARFPGSLGNKPSVYARSRVQRLREARPILRAVKSA
jgi:hypothetical protein